MEEVVEEGAEFLGVAVEGAVSEAHAAAGGEGLDEGPA